MIYAPIGLALEARELIPKLADRGRGQVALTRLAAKVATQHGPGGVDLLLDEVRSVVMTVLGLETTVPTDTPSASVDDVEVLPIEGYQSMSAPDLLEMLEPLSNDDLEALLEFEQEHRARATVINRIQQLRD